MLEQLKNFKPRQWFTIPFWFWNDDLKEEEIKRQIHDFKEKGVDGLLFIQDRNSRRIEYLSERLWSWSDVPQQGTKT